MDTKYHYPPELMQLLIDTVPRLFKSKRDVILFFRGAGVSRSMMADIEDQLTQDRDSISKFEIVRTVLSRLNEAGEESLRERREILKRVTDVEDFSMCWPNDRLEAQGLVSRIRSVVDVKDSFTKMRQERDAELRKHRELKQKEMEALHRKQEALAKIRQDFYSLFAMSDAHERGRLLEGILNRLFKEYGILVRDSFSRVPEPGQRAIEQIDGVIELDGHIYLVEMKWLKEPVGVGDIHQHLGRVFLRGGTRGIFISYSGYTAPAIATCKESLSKTVIALCTLEEFVLLLEKESNLEEFLKAKIRNAIIDKQPFTEALESF